MHSSACEGDRRGSPISGQARLTMELDLTAWHPIFEPFISAVPLKGAVFLFAVRSSHSRHGHRGPPSAISRCTVTETRVRSTVTSCRLNFSRMVHEPGARRAASSTRVRPRAERRAHESSPATDLQRPAEHRSRAELSGAPPPVVKRDDSRDASCADSCHALTRSSLNATQSQSCSPYRSIAAVTCFY